MSGTPMRKRSIQSILPAEKSGNENSLSNGKRNTERQTRVTESLDVIDYCRMCLFKTVQFSHHHRQKLADHKMSLTRPVC